jgi:diguanylate cyclase (GGDEF)-like protein
MTWIKHFLESIKGRLIIGTVILIALLMGVFTYDFINRQYHYIYKQALSQQASVAQLVASNVSLALLNNDLVALKELVNQVKNLTEIDLILISDKNFRIRASSEEHYFNQKLDDISSLELHKKLNLSTTGVVQLQHDGIFDTAVRVKLGGKTIGYVRIISSMEKMNAERQDLLNRGVLYILIAIFLGAFLVWLYVRNLTLRLSLLAAAAAQITEKNYNLTLYPFSGNDELAKMGRAFSVMIDSIHDQVKSLSSEIEQRKKTEELLEYQAHHDELTHLCNRPLFMDRLEHAIKKAKRQNEQLAVLFIDLDRFKEINDSLGHTIGDRVLMTIAERLRDNLREVDTIARLGGDEFTLILEEMNDMVQIDEIAAKLVLVIQKPMQIDEHQLYVTCSIGISLYPMDGENGHSLLRNADSAMYKAKEEGRNSYQYYTQELTERAYARVSLESSLRRAIENKEFIVYYQPQIDGRDDTLIGMEALVRWLHPSEGLIFPNLFIPVAEETGLILAIDAFVMKSAMAQVVKWRVEELNPGVLSLNLAMKQLWQDSFVETIQTMLDETGCRAEWIEFEVTEGEIMKNPEKAIGILKRLHDMGIILAIDDFGTGYSSLSYLKRLPLDILKIDQSFIKGLPDNSEDIAIVRSTIALAKSMGMRVIAEGVETREQKEFLVENGCSHIQGYFYACPLSVAEMDDRLR